MSLHETTLPLSGALRVNTACDCFEQAWKAGSRPRIEDYLAGVPEAERAALVRELVALDMDYRQQAGEAPRPEDYHGGFPELLLAPAVTLAEHPAAGAASSGPEKDLPVVPGYELVKELGRGGMGVVYWAWQSTLNRSVALKMILAGAHAGADDLARFRTEAEAVARLQHPNIVQIHEVGWHDKCPYLALEYIDGGSLAQQLTGTPLPARVAAQLIEGLARAVHYAHLKGVVHRDLTPANILLQVSDGRLQSEKQRESADSTSVISNLQSAIPKITDFGLAKLLVGAGPTLTHTGAVLGTPSYMAPEQAAGQAKAVGPATDVYALGAILYELLTGRPPFKARTPLETLLQVQAQEPVPPSRLQPKLPRDLTTICLKCLEKPPHRRYTSAEALAEDLRRFQAGEPIRARPVSNTEKLWRWCQRNRAMASLLTAVALLLIGIAVVSTFAAVRLNLALTKTQEANRQARLREAEALVGQAHGIRYSRQPGQRFDALDALKQAATIGHELGQPREWFDNLRNEAIAALALPDIHITQTVRNVFESGIHRAEVSSDFELYTRTTEQGACSVLRLSDNVEIAALPELGEPVTPTLGPGRLLLLDGETSKRCQLWDLSGPEPVLRVDQRPIMGRNLRSDGQVLVLRHGDKNGDFFGVYATDTGVGQRHAPDRMRGWVELALHPTEPVLAASWVDSRVLEVRDLGTGAVRDSVATWGSCEWSPDGTTLAVANGGNSRSIQLYIFDRAAGKLRLTSPPIRGPDNGGAHVKFSPAGDRLASRGWNSIVSLYDVHTRQRLFSTHSLRTSCYERLCFDLSGSRLAAARVGPREEQLGLWSVADAREYRALVHEGEAEPDLCLPAVHLNERLVAQGFRHGLALFDLPSGREVAFLKDPGGRNVLPYFDGAGNLVTNSLSGFFRWPVRQDPTQPAQLIIGPAKRLPFKAGQRSIAASRNGEVIAQATFYGYGEKQSGGWILHPSSPALRHVEPQTRMTWASVSPDGCWVAFGHHADRVRAYEAATGQPVWQSPADGHNYCRFTSDGPWLLTDNDGSRAYTVGTWEPGPRLGPGCPWDLSPDGLVVLGLTDGIYRLVERATGREVARLQDPEQKAGAAVFTPDGTRLVIGAKDGLRVWDLRRIRAELAKLGLDWDLPPYPPVGDLKDAPPLRVSVVTQDQALAYVRQGQWDEAARDYALLAESNPDEHWYWYQSAPLCLQTSNVEGYRRACREMLTRFGNTDKLEIADRTAKTCLLAPEAVRDLTTVLKLADRAVTGTEKHPDYRWWVLAKGLAEYRAGHYTAAVDWLNRFSPRVEGEHRDATAFAVLAMAKHRLGLAPGAERARLAKEARAALGHAQAILASNMPDPKKDRPYGRDFHDWLHAQILVHEAERLLPPDGARATFQRGAAPQSRPLEVQIDLAKPP
jgi:serine/threonine protein kinase/WD40 repeat protein